MHLPCTAGANSTSSEREGADIAAAPGREHVMIRPRVLIAVAAPGVTAVSGCASIASQLGAALSASATCATHACVADEIKKDLLGITAGDGAVISKASCKTSTVKRNPGPTWTVA